MCSPDGARRGALTDRSAKAPARRAQRARAATTRGCGGQADPLSRGHKVMRRAGSARTAAGPTAPCSMRLPQERRSSAVGALVTGSLLPAASTPSFLKLAVRSSSVGEVRSSHFYLRFVCMHIIDEKTE
ncbi:hypothetical protein C2845_PM11G17690 [Panicum miliaceum]|uniref:Uncharacterized protein n=1 Tax=Panicum miliaceum TaxID=4540 RepID=A0A3L6RW22_PANMI|nr:hypothetical protein C2845_PM11G17690 [Panicum miliaceum]